MHFVVAADLKDSYRFETPHHCLHMKAILQQNPRNARGYDRFFTVH